MHGKTTINDIHCIQMIFIVVLTTTPDFHVIPSTETLVTMNKTVQSKLLQETLVGILGQIQLCTIYIHNIEIAFILALLHKC